MYDNLKNNEYGIEVLREVYDELGIEINGDHDKIFGSSDAGNVSFVCPTFHPTLQIVDREWQYIQENSQKQSNLLELMRP